MTGLIVVPRHFFTADIIQARKPLSPTARRAGWQGCNILIGQVPPSGRIPLIARGAHVPKGEVLDRWRATRRRRAVRVSSILKDASLNARGWLLAVMKAVEAVGRPEFTLNDVYAHEAALSALYPDNHNVRPKIRQQLQVLRDRGWLEFTARRGTYRLTGPLSRWERGRCAGFPAHIIPTPPRFPFPFNAPPLFFAFSPTSVPGRRRLCPSRRSGRCARPAFRGGGGSVGSGVRRGRRRFRPRCGVRGLAAFSALKQRATASRAIGPRLRRSRSGSPRDDPGQGSGGDTRTVPGGRRRRPLPAGGDCGKALRAPPAASCRQTPRAERHAKPTRSRRAAEAEGGAERRRRRRGASNGGRGVGRRVPPTRSLRDHPPSPREGKERGST
ncbi:MAG: hypothetical protein K2X07_09375 [Caulobacteraceae bacterium]|nr:hypothetical protein [Caulobacteraceae bacterium]